MSRLTNWIRIDGNEFRHSPDNNPDAIIKLDVLEIEITELKAKRDELNAEKLDESTGKNEKEKLAFTMFNDQFDTSELDRQIKEKEALYNHLIIL